MAYYDTELDEFMNRFGKKDDSKTNKFTAKAFGDSGKTGLANFDKKENSGFSNSLVGFQQNQNKKSIAKNDGKGGGMMAMFGGGGGSSANASGSKKGGMSAGQMGAMGSMFGGIGDSMKKDKGELQIGEDADNQMIDGAKDSAAQMIGPIGQLFRGIQKMGQGIGDSIGGESGAAVSGAFSPEEATMANFKDKDLSVGEKLLGTVPGLGAVIAHRSAKKKAAKKFRKAAKAYDKKAKAKLEQEYDQSQGVAANRALKQLRQQQLGIIERNA